MTRTHFALILTITGALALAVGVGLVYLPAGVIVAGLLLLAAGLFFVDLGGSRP